MSIKELLHFFIIPVIIGIIGGFSAYILREMIDLFNFIFHKINFLQNEYFYLITMPAIFYLSHYLIVKLKINPTNVTIDEIAKKISLMAGKFSMLKGVLVLFITSLSIGFGVPVGREGPIAKLGGLATETFILLTKIPRIDIPIYLSAGVSSAIAATFNAPIAGIIFGIEIIIGKINSYIVIPLIVACATATEISHKFLGDFTAFYVPKLFYNPDYIFFVPFEGFFFALVSIFIFFSFKQFRYFKSKYRKKWKYVVIVLGLIVGAIIILIPQTKGVGYEYVSKIFENQFNSEDTIIIMAAKLIALILSIGSGIFGGIVSPSIFIGTFGGFWFGSEFAPASLDPKVFALVGAASLLAGLSRAPLRTAVVITELTHSYQLIAPILVATSITSFFLSKLEPGSYFKRGLFQRGIDVDNKEIINFLTKCDIKRFVEDIKPLTPNMHTSRVIRIFKKEHINYLPVVEDNKLIGIVSLRDIRKIILTKQKSLKVKDIMSKHPFSIKTDYTKEDIFKALSILNASFIPYTTKDNDYIGMLNINKLLKAMSTSKQIYTIKGRKNPK